KGGVVTATGFAFNDAYRYVDWLLTVPLLLIELVLVMRLSREETSSKAIRLGSAAALMIVLGYPGEIASDIPTRAIWGTLSA
ncbi:bacteriorhodopsin, partial [Mycobacterium tuberculosis]|uniref:bacteriorhodopsin n=1 Tax=Mycobacterium tuberculosis TaxID=1773 RepID=UPI0004F2A06B